MLIGDIWLRKRPPRQSTSIRVGQPQVSPRGQRGAGPPGGEGRVLHGAGIRGHLPLYRSALRNLRRGAAARKSSPFVPETRLQMAARSGCAQASSPASLLSGFPPLPSFPPLLLLRDWVPLCGVTNAGSRGPAVHCALPWMCAGTRPISAPGLRVFT